MGIYVNPDGDQFRQAAEDPMYVDKTGLISITNSVIGYSSRNRICVSRPRRFGKTTAIDMLVAYYSKNGDSRDLFSQLKIAEDPSFEEHLNRHNVIHLDIMSRSNAASKAKPPIDPVSYIEERVIRELAGLYPDCSLSECNSLDEALLSIYCQRKEKFIFLLDEWDVIYREDKYDGIRDEYTDWLETLFKGSDVEACIELVYLTGIFPIPQQKTQSAMNNFLEYTMQDPFGLAPYVGFTDTEVKALCKKYNMPYKRIREWYDGYSFDQAPHIYCPRSVVIAIENKKIGNYWNETASNVEIIEAYQSDLPGLQEAIGILLSRQSVHINKERFKRDVGNPQNADDVLAAMVHIGYLVYDDASQTVRIANREVEDEFMKKLEGLKEHTLWKIVSQSKDLLDNTLKGDAEAVAKGIAFAHDYYSNPQTYNNEAALGSVVALAYQYAFAGDYTLLWEFPSGKGYADVVLLPVNASRTNKPILIELKWNKPADAAIRQIINRSYTGRLTRYSEILLVGISYVSDSASPDYKKHTCVIETWKWNNP